MGEEYVRGGYGVGTGRGGEGGRDDESHEQEQ